MKSLLIFTLSLLLSFSALSQPIFEYNLQADRYHIDADKMAIGHFLQSFARYSGLEVQYDKKMNSTIAFADKSAREKDIIRFLDKQFSTIKSYSNNKELLSIVILPKGQFQSSTLIAAIDPIEEGISHKTGNTNQVAKERYRERLLQLDEKVRIQQEQRVDQRLKQKEQEELRAQQHKKSEQKEEQVLISKLKNLQDKHPEYYQHLLEINQNRFPELEQKINQ
jgi:hypothetical protein